MLDFGLTKPKRKENLQIEKDKNANQNNETQECEGGDHSQRNQSLLLPLNAARQAHPRLMTAVTGV